MNELGLIVNAASLRPEVRGGIAALYAEVGERIARRNPACSISGRCCRFEEYGHRLYVTTIELATFVHDLQQARSPTRLQQFPDWQGVGCPFQVRGLCGVHTMRPFGCRMYFCDPTAEQWQNETYEFFHAKLKALHESLEVPYRYVEWRAGLKALGLIPTT